MKKISYSKAGVSYEKLDPVKKLALSSAKNTSKHLRNSGFSEIEASRGESAFVWNQGKILMASVVEGLGTKNLVADAMRKVTGKTYYDHIGHDTISAIINDLITVGAQPLVLHAYWAVGDSEWLADEKRMKDLVNGWKSGCDLSGATWGGGETPALKGIINPHTIDLGGSATGIIKNKKNLITDKHLKAGDRVILIKSSGINVNGLSLARKIAEKLPKKYATKLPSGKMYGEVLLTKANIYAKLMEDLQKAKIDIHYVSNITGHGFRKIMRSNRQFTYTIEKTFTPHEVFDFIQKHAGLSDYEMYETFNMGSDFCLFVSPKDLKKTLRIISKNKFKGLDAGYIQKGERQVIIKPKNITFSAETLDLR